MRFWNSKPSPGLTWALVLFIACSCGSLKAQSVAQLITPANGSAGLMPPVTFSWNPVNGATAYYLYVGTAYGLKDVYDSGETLQTSITRPLDAGTYYATLWTKINGYWFSSTSSFSVISAASKLLSPSNGASVAGSQVSFTWNSVSAAQAYYLYLGTAQGRKDVYDSGETQQLALSRNLSPGTYYARLWTELEGRWYGNDSTFTVLPSPAVLSAPKNGAAAITSPVSFVWSPVQGATNYYLYVGSADGLKDVFDSGETGATQITRVLSPGTYYAMLWTQFSGKWVSSSSTFAVVQPAVLKTPADQAVDVSSPVTFSWNPVPNVQAYYLYVGTSPGLKDVVNSGETLQTSIKGNLLPEHRYYATLYTKTSNQWLSTTSSFFVGQSTAKLTSPVDGAVNVDPFTQFVWNSVPSAESYYVTIGSSLGGKDVWESGAITRTNTYVPFPLASETTYYIRISTLKNNTWTYSDARFTTSVGISKLEFPQDGANGVSPFAHFSWKAANGGAGGYVLYIGGTLGGRDVYDSGGIMKMSATPNGLLPGKHYFARLWTKKLGKWYASDSEFDTSNDAQVFWLGQTRNLLTDTVSTAVANVRSMANPVDNIPTPGTALEADVIGSGATLASCENYSNVLLKELAASSIPNRLRFLTLNGTAYESHTIVEFFNFFNNNWEVADPTFGAVYSAGATGLGVEELHELAASGNAGVIEPQFVTLDGDSIMRGYYMDPLTLYTNIYAPGGLLKGLPGSSDNYPTSVSPQQYLEEKQLADVEGIAGGYLFKFIDASDFVTIGNNGQELTITGASNTAWSKFLDLPEEWTIRAGSDKVQIFTMRRPKF